MRYKFSEWLEAKKQFFTENDMPDKGDPVIIVFGGTFSPVHKEHMDTAKQAIQFVESQGYNVSKAIMAPVGDGYAKVKLGEDFIPLKDRVAMINTAAQSYPGVMGTDEPGKLGDTMPKMKRTMLADWARSQYRGATIMALCGSDSCPPTPPSYPSIYTGDPGTSHHGYWYISWPRDEAVSISSTKIRNAIKQGKSVNQWLPPGVEDMLKRIYNRVEPAVGQPTGHAAQQAVPQPSAPSVV